MVELSRRKLLQLSAFGVAAQMFPFRTLSAFAQSTDYKALVCIFLFGGNDSNNMVVPMDGQAYQDYLAVRGASPIVQDASALLQLGQIGDRQNQVNYSNQTIYGLHPSMGALHGYRNNLAVVANVGSLFAPMTKDQYRSPTPVLPRPQSLFSHSDQQRQMQDASPLLESPTGWGGRSIDQLVGFNQGAVIPSGLSTSGNNIFLVGDPSQPVALGGGGTILLRGTGASLRTPLQQTLGIGSGSGLMQAANSTQGVFKSTDGGTLWNAANVGLNSARKLAIDPQTPSTLYAGGDGIFKSTDGGESWAAASQGLPGSSFLVALVIDPQNPTTLYAGMSDGVFRSDDGGTLWNAVGVGTTPDRITALAIDPHDPATLYAGGDVDEILFETFLYKSTDRGDTWTRTFVASAPTVVLALAIDPQTPGTLYATLPAELSGATHAYLKSVDGGNLWDLESFGPGTLALAINPQAPTTLYAATSAGVRRSTDGATTWSAVNEGLATTRVEALAVSARAPGTLYAGAVEGIFRSADGSDSWARVDEDFLLIDSFKTLAIDPAAATTVFAVITAQITDITFDLVVRSDDAGAHWRPIENGLPVDGLREDLVIDPLHPTTLYLAAWADGVFKSTDGGDSWSPASQGLAGLSVGTLAIDPLIPQRLYAAGFDGLAKSLDGGTTWQNLSGGLPEVSGSPEINLLEIDPRTPETLYVHGRFGLAKSTDGGASWLPVGPGLEGEIAALAIDPELPSTLYAGGDAGVFLSTDGGESWTALNQGLAVLDIATLAIDPNDSSTVYAGTYGGGVFAIERLTGRETLALAAGRFTVEVSWRDFGNETGTGKVAVLSEETSGAAPLKSSDSAVAQFFDPDNWELLVKVLDGTAINDHFWVFLAAATDVELTTTVTDLRCGATRSYVNPLGEAAPAVTDITAFPDCADPLPAVCVEEEGAICLSGGRFRVETSWRDEAGATGPGELVSIPEAGLAKSDDSGLFYFFSRDNWELLIKVLDGCGINDHFWVFAAATTNVETTVTVTDTATEQVKTYTNPLGRAAEAITDTTAFATCSDG